MNDEEVERVSLVGMLRESVLRDPKSPIAIDAGGAEPLMVTREAFWLRVCSLRAELAGKSVGRGDCVAVWLPNWSDTLVWQFATAALGAHVIGLNTRYNVDEVAHVLTYARPVVLAIAHDFARLDLAARLHDAVKAAHIGAFPVAVVAGPHGARADAGALKQYDIGAGAWVPGQASAAAGSVAQTLDDFPDALAVAFTTSGSTGQPKLAAHTSRAVAGHAQACAKAGGWRPSDVTLCALPLSGVFCFIPAMATIASGGACLLEPVFEPEKIVADMARFGVTHVIAADDVVERLADEWKQHPVALARWRRLLIGDFKGKSLELAQWAERQFGLAAGGVYGSSELFSLTALWPPSVPSPRRWQGGGVPVSPRIEVRCANPESGDICAAGETGELQFRGPNVVDAYLGAPELRARQLTPDGWFRSGDLGTVHTDGSFDYLCRAGDALRIKGFLVEPAEIENRLAMHAAVAIAKVVGVKLTDGAIEPVAFVVLVPGAECTPQALQSWCAEGLARYKVPRNVHVIDEMPVTSGVNGMKIKAAELRQWAQQREDASHV